MAPAQQSFGGGVAALDFVGHDRRKRHIGYRTVDQDRRYRSELGGRSYAVVIHGRVDDAVNLTLEHQCQRGAFEIAVVAGIGE